jgi:hypothetical protein
MAPKKIKIVAAGLSRRCELPASREMCHYAK